MPSPPVNSFPSAVVANASGEIIDCPEFSMLGTAGSVPALPDYWIPLPQGSDLFTMPGRVPVVFDQTCNKPVLLNEYYEEPVQPVAAFVAPAYTSLMHPSYTLSPHAPRLPLYCYTAVGWHNDSFCVPALRIDSDSRQDASSFDESLVAKGAQSLLTRYPENRLVNHLMQNCCLTYHCPAARNFALGRWEMPLPVSQACNSRCIGCISYQPGDHVCAAQERINFKPTPEEIAEITIPHLESAQRPIASFGQGCEGEPLTEYRLIADAISRIRDRTPRGTINLNTNASRPDCVQAIIDAGLDSMRVSLNSARPGIYHRYFNPIDYSFSDVLESIRIARQAGVFVSLNYFVFPGFTDQLDEYSALRDLLACPGADMIQWRNLNIDPDWYRSILGDAFDSDRMGMRRLLDTVQNDFPSIRSGYFNPFLG